MARRTTRWGGGDSDGGDEGGGLAAAAPSFNLDDEDFAVLDGLAPASGSAAAEAARLCWKTDPLKSLDFE